MGTPLKLEGGVGDLKQMTTGEEAYLAYRASLQLAASTTSDVGALTTTAGGTNIGSYTNTFFNEPVGTHPGTSITSGSTTTTIYQNTGTASEASVDFHRPIEWDATLTGIQEMDDTAFNTLVDRLMGLVWANNYPGVYTLGSTSPGADHDIHIAGVFSDTRTDGTTVIYNIYQRQSMASPPSAVRSIKIFNDTTAFDGLKEMNDTEISVTIGQRMKTRIMSSADNIGSYQIRSSAQGAPVAAGTWVAKGTATDTKNTTAEVNYTTNFIGNYSGTYTRDRLQDFSGTYTRDRLQDFSGTYTRDRLTNFTSIFTRDRLTNFTRTSTRDRLQNFFNRTFGGTAFTGNFIGNFIGDFVGNFIGDYTGDFIGNFIGNYTGIYTGNFIGNYTGIYTGNFIGNYTGAYAGDYTGDFIGTTIAAGTQTIETYTLYVRTA